MSRYDFTELATRAINDETPENLRALAEWCESYGNCWNGECWDVSLPDEPTGTRSLYPVYEEQADEIFIIGYELR